LFVSEHPVSGLGVSLNLLDLAEEALDGLVGIPFFVKAFGVGL
jgi:hypothetical protein